MRVDTSHSDLCSLDDDTGFYRRFYTESWHASATERLDRFFGVSGRGSSLQTELWGGCVTWLSMSYSLLVIPLVLQKADNSEDLHLEPLIASTALTAALGSVLTGLLGHVPLGLMPGTGLNVYFTFGLCRAFGITFGQALSCCLVSGIILLCLSMLGAWQWIVRQVLPGHLSKAITMSVGLLQAMIGFEVMGLIVSTPYSLASLGDLRWWDPRLYLGIGGLCFVSALLIDGRIHGALPAGISAVALVAWGTGLEEPPRTVMAWPRFDMAFAVDFTCWSLLSGKPVAMVTGTLAALVLSLFDTLCVTSGLCCLAGLLRDGEVPRRTWIHASSAVTTIAGSLLGTSPVIVANESSAGIAEGARTGLAACVVGVLFVASSFAAPLIRAVPKVAAALPLIVIGACMMEPSRGIGWDNLRIALPSFLTVALVPFTYSIHDGIICGMLMDAFLGFISKLSKELRTRASLNSFGRGTANGAGSPSKLLQPVLGQPTSVASDPLNRRMPMPHAAVFMTGGNLSDAEKVDRVRQLLHDLGPRFDGKQASETWEQALRKSLEAYLEAQAPRVAQRPCCAGVLARAAQKP